MVRPLTVRMRKLLAAPGPKPGWLIGILAERKAQMQRFSRPNTPFFVGDKNVYLPGFTISLLRTPHLGPRWAQFRVPLSFNKLDLRDYLFHVYNVRVKAIRSFIKQQPVQEVERGSVRDIPGKKRWYRPKAQKKMMVELEKPFVWPEEPTDMAPWEKERADQMRSIRQAQAEGNDMDEAQEKNRGNVLAETAEMLRRGQTKWRSADA